MQFILHIRPFYAICNKKRALRLTRSLTPHLPLPVFYRGLTSKLCHDHGYFLFAAYVDPFAHSWLGLSTSDPGVLFGLYHIYHNFKMLSELQKLLQYLSSGDPYGHSDDEKQYCIGYKACAYALADLLFYLFLLFFHDISPFTFSKDLLRNLPSS